MTELKLIPSERKEQIALIDWAKLNNIPLVHHVNEGKRTARMGAIFKRSGLAPGYPDLSLSVARGGYFGLYMELKQNRKYTPSEMNQKSWKLQQYWLEHLSKENYFTARCFGWEKAKHIIEVYLSWPKTCVLKAEQWSENEVSML